MSVGPGNIAGVRLGLDYSAGRPGGAAIRGAGFDFVVRYLTDGGPTLPGKLLTPAEADDLRAHGVSIVSNWETTNNRMLDGFGAGANDATAGLAHVLACGGRRDRPIYFSVDFDATPDQQGPIDDYLRGAATVLGRQNVGIYGGYWPISRALDHGTAAWAWQTDAWSGGNIEQRRAMHQRTGTIVVGGVECDVDEAFFDDFGQWDHQPQEEDLTPEEDAILRDIQIQMRGPGLGGWPQLGKDDQGHNRTVVDALAVALKRIEELEAKVDDLSSAWLRLPHLPSWIPRL
jgi:hypothetical protein